MTFLRNQAAWLVLSLLLSGVWWLMTHTGGAAPVPTAPTATSPAPALNLSTTARLTLASGEVVSGVISGPQALCPSWNAQLAAGDLHVTLPDGRTLRGSEVQAIDAAPATLGGLAELVTTTACGETLTLHMP